MTLSTQPYKGARDFYPEDMRLQKYIFSVWRRVCERFGYEEFMTPMLEPTEMFMAKGNQEIVNEQTYSFTDRGGRAVTIRTEMTPSVSRLVAAKRQELAYPLRLYVVPELWRYERTQRGRLRQFWQLNADVFGIEGMAAEHEIIMLTDAIMKEFGATERMFNIRVNHRGLTDLLFRDYLGLDEDQAGALVRLVDKRAKMDENVFRVQLNELLSVDQRDTGLEEQIFAILETKTLSELPEAVRSSAPVRDLMLLDDMLKESGVTSVVFDITLMRGFDYYTGVVFEVFDKDPDNNRAMFGGGRYDGLVGMFGVETVPTVGFGMGDVTLQNFLTSHDLLPRLQTETDLYVVFIGDNMYEKSVGAISKLRQEGVNVAVDSSGRKIDRQLKSAVKKGVTFVMFVGDTELASGQFKLKNLVTGEEELHSLERIASIVLALRPSQDKV